MAGLLNAEVWSEFFHQLERCCTDALATVQFQTRGQERHSSHRRRPLRAIRYDGRRDVVELSAGGEGDLAPAVRYFIRSPRRITVEEAPAGSRILIEDGAQGVTEIAIEEPDAQQASRVAVELGQRFTRERPGAPAPGVRSIVGRLAMRRDAGARAG
ncbi:MAG TPA: hypothetical protein VLZ06_09235 [Solirubrobacteraceae bacterium]|nr:hypothetical protein [Solirubrobacteraceae bacterium]